MSTALDRFYAGIENVVLRDSDGNPSIYVRHPKQNSNEFFDFLPNHVHPAFQCGSSTTDDAILIGKYKASQPAVNGAIYSLPNTTHVTLKDLGGVNNAIDKAKSGGATLMTIADYGLLALIAAKNGIKLHGNTQHGTDYWKNTASCQYYQLSKAYAVGDRAWFRGWLVECLTAHTSSLSLLPCDAPSYWKYIRKDFGTQIDFSNNSFPNGLYALTGSGPIDWYFNSDIRLEADLVGTKATFIPDFRIVNRELQIIPYNLAADPDTDISTTSAQWKAILPSSSDTSVTYVAPGTSGTLKLAWATDHWEYTARAIDESEFAGDAKDCKFDDVTVDEDTVPYTPALLYEIGMLPIPGISYGSTGDRFDVWRNKNTYYVVVFGNLANMDVGFGRHNMRQNVGELTNADHGMRTRARIV